MSRADHRKHDAELHRQREISRRNHAEKSIVLRLSVEGSLGIAAGVIVFVLDKMGVGGTLVYAVLLLTAAILCIHAVVRSEWARSSKRRQMLGGGITLAFYVAFGAWLFLRPPTESETDRKLDELLESRAYSPEKLHAKYPGNYFIFEVDYEDKQDKARLLRSTLGNLEFDFSVVRIREVAPNGIEIRLPDVRQKGDGLIFSDVTFSGDKRVGPFGGQEDFSMVMKINKLPTSGGSSMSLTGEILAIRENGLVLLFGFAPAPNFGRP